MICTCFLLIKFVMKCQFGNSCVGWTVHHICVLLFTSPALKVKVFKMYMIQKFKLFHKCLQMAGFFFKGKIRSCQEFCVLYNYLFYWY